jgi:hypothetical protein
VAQAKQAELVKINLEYIKMCLKGKIECKEIIRVMFCGTELGCATCTKRCVVYHNFGCCKHAIYCEECVKYLQEEMRLRAVCLQKERARSNIESLPEERTEISLEESQKEDSDLYKKCLQEESFKLCIQCRINQTEKWIRDI